MAHGAPAVAAEERTRSRRRVVELDMARGLAILAVVAIHATAFGVVYAAPPSRTYWALAVTNIASTFAVPVFLVVSGFGLSRSWTGQESYVSWLSRRLAKVLPAYVVWSGLYLALSIARGGAVPSARGLVVAAAGGAAYHLYFIPVIVQCYVLFPLLRRFLLATPGMVLCLALSAAVGFLPVGHITAPGLAARILVVKWIGYFAFGVWASAPVRGARPAGSRWWLPSAIVVCLGALVTVFAIHRLSAPASVTAVPLRADGQALGLLTPGFVPYALLIWAWIWSRQWREGWVTRGLAYLARVSYGVYLAHVMVLEFYHGAYTRCGLSLRSPLFAAGAFLFSLGGCVLLMELGALLRRWARAVVRPAARVTPRP